MKLSVCNKADLYWIAAIVLLFPALLINLGLQAFIDDEAIRALVALEMQLSGDLITPTLAGDLYYKKPPLFNWLILFLYELSGRTDEFISRSVTVLALIAYGISIYIYLKRHFKWQEALVVTFMVLTCGRILFWDSFLGLIDITFSWVIFLLFMEVYHRMEKKQWLLLFVISYFLAAIGFLLKGLPAVVFLLLTLLAAFWAKRQVRPLFGGVHLMGVVIFLTVTGAYYGVYFQSNGLEKVFATLFEESAQRTVVRYGLGRTILHLFTFPFEMLYHFLPWSLFLFYFINKDARKVIWNNDFLKYCLLIFLVNLVPYWTSPQVYPRYLHMFLPLIFAGTLALHSYHSHHKTSLNHIIRILFMIGATLVLAGSFLPHLLQRTQIISGVHWKAALLTLALLPAVFLFAKGRGRSLSLFVIVLLLFRIGFNWFVIPDRTSEDPGSVIRTQSIQLAQRLIGDNPLYLYKSTAMGPTHAYYITRTTKSIIRRKHSDFDQRDIYILTRELYPDVPFVASDTLFQRHHSTTLCIGRLQ